MTTGNSTGSRDKEAWRKKVKREDNIFMAIVIAEAIVVVATINYVMATSPP